MKPIKLRINKPVDSTPTPEQVEESVEESTEETIEEEKPRAVMPLAEVVEKTLNKTDFFNYFTNGFNDYKELFIAELLKAKMKDLVKTTSSNSKGYHYDKNTKFWIPCSTKEIIQSRGYNFILPMINECIEDTYGLMAEAKSEERETITLEARLAKQVKIKSSLTTIKFWSSIGAQVSYSLTDLEFPNKLNQTGNMLPVKNGKMLDLITGVCRDRQIQDYVNYELDTEYNPTGGALFHEVEEFFENLMLDKKGGEKYEFFKRLCGYILLHGNPDQQFFIFYNERGSNGKGTLMKMFHHLLTDNLAVAGRSEQIDQVKSEKMHEEFRLSLENKRLVYYPEMKIEDDFKINEYFIKTFTGDTTSARPLFGKVRSFQINSCGILCTNKKPELSGDPALNRRLCLVPFSTEFCDNPILPHQKLKDSSLDEKMKTPEWKTAFLTFCIQGLHNYLGNGRKLNPPIEFLAEDANYKKNANSALCYINNHLYPTNKQLQKPVQAKDIYNKYQQWCQDESLEIKSLPVFGKAMKDRFEFVPDTNRIFYYCTDVKPKEASLKALREKQKELERELLEISKQIKELEKIESF